MQNASRNIKQKSARALLRMALIAGLVLANETLATAESGDITLHSEPMDAQLNYEISVENMEAQYGPYHAPLSQELTSLGQYYRSQGLLEDSREALQRAMHISRVNSGLYSLEQAPIIEQLVKTNTERRDWESVDANQHYLFWLHRRNYSQDDPRMIPILNKLGRWHLNAYDNHTHKGKVEHLLRAHNYYKQAINIVSREHGTMAPELIDHLQGYTATNYYLASHQIFIYQEADSAGSVRNSKITTEEKRRLLQYIHNSYRNGKNSIDQAIRIHSNNDKATLQDKVGAELALADWNLLFGHWHTALSIYKNIHGSLSQLLPKKTSADTFFSHPVPLPQLPTLDRGISNSATSDPYILAAFDVSPKGNVRNIEFIEEFPEKHIQNRIRVRRTLKASKFRPRMLEGEPVATERFTQKFVFPAEAQ